MNLAIFRRDVPVLSATILVLATIFVAHQHAGRRAAGADRPAHPAVGARRWRRMPPIAAGRSRLRGGSSAHGGASATGRACWRARCARDKVTLAVIAAARVPSCSWSMLAPLVHRARSLRRARCCKRLKPIGTPGHWLGTDEVGRDLWTRMVYGGRLSLLCGVVPVFLALLIGGILGVLAGYAGGIVNSADHARRWTCSTPSRRSCWPSPSAACSAPASATPSWR